MSRFPAKEVKRPFSMVAMDFLLECVAPERPYLADFHHRSWYVGCRVILSRARLGKVVYERCIRVDLIAA